MRRSKRLWVHSPLLVLLAISLTAAIAGVDFGFHWDEQLVLESLDSSAQTGLLIPRVYNYPSIRYDLTLVLFLIKTDFALLRNTKAGEKAGQEADRLVAVSRSPAFKLQTRTTFIVVTYLCLVWIYLLVFVWRRNWAEALLASSLVGLSWEVGYHSRWITPDTVMMQFGALTMACLFLSLNDQTQNRAKLWLVLAAVAAGLTCGTKYPGGLILLPVLIGAVCLVRTTSTKRLSWLVLGEVVLVFTLTYLVTTPGTIIDFRTFSRDLTQVKSVYGSMHGGYTVANAKEHVFLVLKYFSLVAFSKYSVVAFVFFLAALAGTIDLLKNERRNALLFLCFPMFYTLYMCTLKVMIVRNYMIVIPFMAVFASRGCVLFYRFMGRRALRVLFVSMIAGLLFVNAVWLARAARSVRMKNQINQIEQLSHYLDRKSDQTFFLSSLVANDLFSGGGKPRPNVASDLSAARAAIFYSSEVQHRDWRLWTANRYNYVWTWFGPYEVNFNYYPSWNGDNRIVVMPVDSARPLGLR